MQISLPLAFFFVLENLISEQRKEGKKKNNFQFLLWNPSQYTKMSFGLLEESPIQGHFLPCCLMKKGKSGMGAESPNGHFC